MLMPAYGAAGAGNQMPMYCGSRKRIMAHAETRYLLVVIAGGRWAWMMPGCVATWAASLLTCTASLLSSTGRPSAAAAAVGEGPGAAGKEE